MRPGSIAAFTFCADGRVLDAIFLVDETRLHCGDATAAATPPPTLPTEPASIFLVDETRLDCGNLPDNVIDYDDGTSSWSMRPGSIAARS